MTGDKLIYFYCFVGGALLLLVLLGLAAAASMPGMNRLSKRFFLSSFSILMLSIVAYFVDLFAYADPGLALTERVVAIFETFLPSLLMPLLAAYILQCCGERRRGSALYGTVLALCAALFILLCITQFTKSIYYFTADNQFVRGPLYPVLIVPLAALIVVNLVGVIRRRKKLPKKYDIAFLVYLIPLLITLIAQIFVTVFPLIVIAVTISALSMFGIIMADQVEQYLHQQRKISNQSASIAVLQMRPHFIYNTMMSIYYLCEQDPQKAQKITLDFTAYLRKNFNAVASEDTISFAEELEHTRAYLAVEQAQFEENLSVAYDTPHTLFRLPPLTLQPIVENAVKHGMDPDAAEPLHISIRTAKTDCGSEIVVEDNGPGFQMNDDKAPHPALDNIRQRLEIMCAGKLTIEPRSGGGTVVTVFVPREKA